MPTARYYVLRRDKGTGEAPWHLTGTTAGPSPGRGSTPSAGESEQEVDGVPVFVATRARGTWRLRHHRSTRVIGGFRTIEEVRAYAPRLLADAA